MSNIERNWTEWIDYKESNISGVPKKPGVFMMHAAMKILFIGSTNNLKNDLNQTMDDQCISNATRFRYMLTDKQKEVKEELINEYLDKHDGILPKCME